jgi:hypothetical protein
VKLASWLNPPPVFVEIGPDRLRARQGHASVELPLERGPEGRLTAQGKEKTILALKEFVKAKSWLPRARAWCAISARGVSFRRLSLPGGTREEFQPRLLLQIEAEFPLPPEELAWGSQPLGQPQPANGAIGAPGTVPASSTTPQGGPQTSNGAPGRQDLLVAAVKKELLEDYREILRACGTEPVFTPAALARWQGCGQPANSFAMLDIGPRQSELTVFDNGVPSLSRIIFWDGKNVSNPAGAPLDALAQNLKGSLTGSKLLVSGEGISKDFTDRLACSLGNGCKCERPEITPADGGSAALSGLEKFADDKGAPALLLRLDPASSTASSLAALDWKTWGARMGALAAVLLLLPYAEALLLKPHLAKKVAAFKVEAERLKVIDRELDFLRGLKLSQPPYLDLLYVLSKSAPTGTRFDSLSLNSHGEVALRGAFHDGQQVADFRNKLIASGFFTNVVVEEQAPTPDRQKVNVRMSALEKSATELQAASARLAADDAKKDEKSAAPGMPAEAPVSPKKLK